MTNHLTISDKIEGALEEVFKDTAIITKWQSQWEVECHQEVEHFDHENSSFKKVFNDLVSKSKFYYDMDVAETVKKICQHHVSKLSTFDWQKYCDDGTDGNNGYEIDDCVIDENIDLDKMNFEPLQKAMDDAKLAQIIPLNSKEHVCVEYLLPYFEETFKRYSLDIRPDIANGKPFEKFLKAGEVAPFDRHSKPLKAIVQTFVKNNMDFNIDPVFLKHFIMDLLVNYKCGDFKVLYPIMNIQNGKPLVAGDSTSNIAFHNLSRIEDWDVSAILEGIQKLKLHLIEKSDVETSKKPRKQMNLK